MAHMSTRRPSEPPPLTADEQRQIDERLVARAANPQSEPIPGVRTQHSRWDIAPAALNMPDSEQWYQIIDTSAATAPSFHVRISEDASGRLIITGLHIDGDIEITGRVLREITPAEIVRTIAWRSEGGTPPRSAGDVVSPTGLHRFEGVAMEIEQIRESAQPVETKRGRPGPTDEQLRVVVDVYRRHARETRNAIAATTREVSRSRASVQRWLDLAHERGLFPEGRRRPSTNTREEDQ